MASRVSFVSSASSPWFAFIRASVAARWRAALLALGVATSPWLVASAAAEPVFESAEDAVEFRQSALTLMGAYSQSLANVARGRTDYDPDQVRDDVAVFQVLATLPWQAFGPGTEGGNARPEVWQDSEKFAAAAATLQDNMAGLMAAADSGNFDQVRAAFGQTANSCKACHDSFRQRR